MCVNLSNNLHICVYIVAFFKICNQFFVKLKIYPVFLKNNFWDLSTATFSPKSMVFNHILLYIKKKQEEEEEKKYFLKRKRFPIFCKIQQRFVMSNNVKWSENACLFYIIFLCNKYSDGSHTRNQGCFGFWKTWGLRNIFKAN